MFHVWNYQFVSKQYRRATYCTSLCWVRIVNMYLNCRFVPIHVLPRADLWAPRRPRGRTRTRLAGSRPSGSGSRRSTLTARESTWLLVITTAIRWPTPPLPAVTWLKVRGQTLFVTYYTCVLLSDQARENTSNFSHENLCRAWVFIDLLCRVSSFFLSLFKTLSFQKIGLTFSSRASDNTHSSKLKYFFTESCDVMFFLSLFSIFSLKVYEYYDV